MKTTKVCLGFPWYNGPDAHTYTRYMEIVHYFGRLQERSYWLNSPLAADQDRVKKAVLPPLSPEGDEECEITAADGVFEFGYSNEGGLSLPGLAREEVVEGALAWGADWLFMWDDDMIFPWSSFLKLWRHQKPVVAALAFTSRVPFQPVIYRVREVHDRIGLKRQSEPILDYPKDQLISDADIGGPIAFGAGVVLINMNVFKQLGKPWFHSTGCGEDWMFCLRCLDSGIPRYVDTSVKTIHKGYRPTWVDEQTYESHREAKPEVYEAVAKDIR